MKTALLYLLLAASHGSDAYLTNRNINTGRYRPVEMNPLMRPFVHGQSWLAVSNAAGFGLQIGVDQWLRHKHHRRLADAWLYTNIGEHTCGAITSRP